AAPLYARLSAGPGARLRGWAAGDLPARDHARAAIRRDLGGWSHKSGADLPARGGAAAAGRGPGADRRAPCDQPVYADPSDRALPVRSTPVQRRADQPARVDADHRRGRPAWLCAPGLAIRAAARADRSTDAITRPVGRAKDTRGRRGATVRS